MKIEAKKIRIEFGNSSEDYWEASCESGLELDEAIRMITRAWEEHDASAEPLIKDEKIRKAVRAWAEANKTNHVWVSVASDGINITQDEQYPPSTRYKQSITFECEVEFKSNYYTIDELCGEEEE